uniref:Putative phosphatidylinositol (3,5) kinase n=1 Tax=Trypanosoma congolense (strain IL3000) TaxID=1068625 RepID=G0UZD3_TRYCI|nr:putative phosphatidylinositol (3,5) kinase [Trypanosoma congolense IL3000]
MSDGSNGGDRAMEALTDRSLWVDDRYATRCRGCESSFTLLRRRHHCRHCGQIFCNDCLANTSPSIAKNILTDKISALIGLRVGGSGKVCHECKYILLRRRKTERQSLQTCAAVKSLSNHRLSEMVISPVAVTTSGAAPLCEAGAMGKTGTEAQSGMESVEGFYASSGQRCEGYSVNMAVPEFSQSAASSLGSTALHYDEPPTTGTVPTHPEGAKERSITYGLADVPLHSCNTMSLWLNNLIKESRRQKRMGTSQSPKPVCRPRVLEVSPWASFLVAREAEARNFAMANVFSPSAPREELLLLSRLVSHHLMKRASLLFMSENKLASNTTMERKDWVARICDLAWRVVAQAAVFPREHLLAHLDVICVPGGSLADAEIINGVAFLQKVAFRGMKTTVRAPRILLLAGNVETAIKPLADLTEHIETCKGYLDKHYQRIKMWNPSVIVVEGRMHHYLLDKILEESHITLVLQAGKTVIHRLSRCCSAAVVRDLQYVSSVDLCDSTVLGTCELFQLLQVGGKSICAFSGLRAPLFTTVLLRGCGGEQLDAVRRVLFNCAATAYHLSLQVHCMMDLGFRCKAEPLDITTEDGILKPEYWENLSSTVSQDHSETLSMNIAIEFPKEREHADGKRNKFIVDSLEVNTAFVDTAAGDSAVGATQTSSACPSTRQSREMHNFYSGGDDTVCGYLVARALEGDSTRLIAHGNKRI